MYKILGLGWTGGREANSDDLVDGCKESELGWALEVSEEQSRATAMPWLHGSPLLPKPSQSPKDTNVSQALTATPQGDSLPMLSGWD